MPFEIDRISRCRAFIEITRIIAIETDPTQADRRIRAAVPSKTGESSGSAGLINRDTRRSRGGAQIDPAVIAKTDDSGPAEKFAVVRIITSRTAVAGNTGISALAIRIEFIIIRRITSVVSKTDPTGIRTPSVTVKIIWMRVRSQPDVDAVIIAAVSAAAAIIETIEADPAEIGAPGIAGNIGIGNAAGDGDIAVKKQKTQDQAGEENRNYRIESIRLIGHF